jgi:hypothetical protein
MTNKKTALAPLNLLTCLPYSKAKTEKTENDTIEKIDGMIHPLLFSATPLFWAFSKRSLRSISLKCFRKREALNLSVFFR